MEAEKQQKMAEYIQSMAAIEDCMRPYREQRKELRRNFMENRWLSKDEISLAMKAFRMLQHNVDFDNLSEIYENLSYTISGGNPHDLGEE